MHQAVHWQAASWIEVANSIPFVNFCNLKSRPRKREGGTGGIEWDENNASCINASCFSKCGVSFSGACLLILAETCILENLARTAAMDRATTAGEKKLVTGSTVCIASWGKGRFRIKSFYFLFLANSKLEYIGLHIMI